MAAKNTPQSPTNNALYERYASTVAKVVLAGQVGTVPTIPNALASGELNTALLTDPLTIRAYRDSVAKQMNASSKANGGPTFEDLTERIADLIIETSAQGASTLEVHLIDPSWVIPMSGFITVDELGYLWPPVDINFPSDTKCVWRLVQMTANWDPEQSDANLVLTFEDKIVSLLREMSGQMPGGIRQGKVSQTLGQFIRQLVDNTNKVLGADLTCITLVAPDDPNAVVTVQGSPTNPEATVKTAGSANQRAEARRQRKLEQRETASINRIVNNIDRHIDNLFGDTRSGATIQAIETQGIAKQRQLQGTTYDPGPGAGAGNAP